MERDYVRHDVEDYKSLWCHKEFECDSREPGYDKRMFSCRRPKGHSGLHNCPAHDEHCNNTDACPDLSPTAEEMDYIYKTFGIIPEEGIQA